MSVHLFTWRGSPVVEITRSVRFTSSKRQLSITSRFCVLVWLPQFMEVHQIRICIFNFFANFPQLVLYSLDFLWKHEETWKRKLPKRRLRCGKVTFQEEVWQVSSHLPWDAGKNALTKATTAHGAKLQGHFNEYRDDEWIRRWRASCCLTRRKLSWSRLHLTVCWKGNSVWLEAHSWASAVYSCILFLYRN